jgi:hypothetical protein
MKEPNVRTQRWRLAVRCSALLAICFESFMEHDIALRKVPVKRKSEEYLLRNALVDKSVNILKSKFPVVLRMSH